MQVLTDEVLAAAMWAGDVDTLHELAPCGCCCHEHTFSSCAARVWGGCRSGLGPGETLEGDEQAWKEHYARFHGMTEAQFYGMSETEFYGEAST
jgi:hypothetical protein